jgi:hypothetical protein
MIAAYGGAGGLSSKKFISFESLTKCRAPTDPDDFPNAKENSC